MEQAGGAGGFGEGVVDSAAIGSGKVGAGVGAGQGCHGVASVDGCWTQKLELPRGDATVPQTATTFEQHVDQDQSMSINAAAGFENPGKSIL